MSEHDKARWEERYATGAYGGRTHPSELLSAWAPQVLASLNDVSCEVPDRPRALDLACGTGRNARYLAELGFAVDGLDIAESGLARARELAGAAHLGVHWLQQDLEHGLGAEFSGYDLIVIFRYVNLPLLRDLPRRLKPGGWLICEQHLQTDAAVIGPGNPAFRVAPGALTEAVTGLEIQLAEEGLSHDPDGRPVALARLVGRRPA